MSGRELDQAFILHARDYRDTSQILDVLTRSEGRFSVVVRGSRSSRSKNRGRLQPFVPLLLASVGKGELRTSTTIEFPANPHRLTGDNLLLAMYINELLYRLLGRYDPMPELYDAYSALLASLESSDDAVARVRLFELLLLQELGYGISFGYSASTGQPMQPGVNYRYVVHEGFIELMEGEELNDDAYPGEALLAISRGELQGMEERKLRNITRRSLAELLGDKPLKSRALFR